MAGQHTSQLGDFFRAFLALIDAFTWPVSSQKLFPDGVQPVIGEYHGTAGFPRCLFRIQSSQADDHNTTSRKNYDVTLELQQQVIASESGDAALFGAHRTGTDEAATVGLIDLDAKISSAAGYFTTADDAELNSYIEYVGSGAPEMNGNVASLTMNFKAHVVIV